MRSLRTCSLILIAGLVSQSRVSTASAAIGGPRLSGFSLQSSSKKFIFTAKASEASISVFSDLIAARDVDLKIEDLDSKKTFAYRCGSFTFRIADTFVMCEIPDSGKYVTLDLAHSELILPR